LSKEKKGDIYLGDSEHHALTTKFHLDFMSEGLIGRTVEGADQTLFRTIRKEQGGLLY
jgi:hypothetical protein